jgi:hypothetical protein
MLPAVIVAIALFIAVALQPPMVQAGHTTPLAWKPPAVFAEADWCFAQNFGGATPHENFGGTLVTNFLALAKLAPPARLRTLLELLKPSIVKQVLMAFRNQDNQGVRSATAAPAIEPCAEALYDRLIKSRVISVEQASAAPDGPVIKEWGEVVFEQFTGKTGLGAIMKILEPIIAEKLAELLAAAPQITTYLDDTVLASDSDRPTHTATRLDRLRVPVFLRVAKRLWLRINLLRFFTEGVWARAPVLYGHTGVQSLFAPVNVELGREKVMQFADSEELYEWIRDMLTVVEFTASFVLCMDCLCR